ncbi:hypothetical protein IIB79_05420, partial [candidate division KSB1 bacterium]|nr:hypothetical protein [candidate division KSB1 bacterium]
MARVIEIINNYVIEFEYLGTVYAVNLVGANSNIADRLILNEVSVRSANSAGLVSTIAIEHGEFEGGVTLDIIKGVTGSEYPKGT